MVQSIGVRIPSIGCQKTAPDCLFATYSKPYCSVEQQGEHLQYTKVVPLVACNHIVLVTDIKCINKSNLFSFNPALKKELLGILVKVCKRRSYSKPQRIKRALENEFKTLYIVIYDITWLAEVMKELLTFFR